MFVITLARASKRARRYLRGLERADKDDIIASAILWCWENRTTYSPSVSLDTWFVGAVRNARTKWALGETHEAAEVIETIGVPDDTSARAEVRLTIERLVAKMNPRQLKIADLVARGFEQDDIAHRLDLSVTTIKRDLHRIREWQERIPESHEWRKALHASPKETTKTDHYEGSTSATHESWIDKEIAKLEFAPPAGNDCPPCWRCKWFEGYLPTPNTVQRIPITVEPEIRASVLNIEARKVEIAGLVRAGLFER